MNQPTLSPQAARARQLHGYWQQDPTNAALLTEACEAAMAAGWHAQATALIDAAESLGLDPLAWTFRRAQSCLARRRLDEAQALLERVQAMGGGHPAVAHDLACTHLLRGEAQACREALAPWLAGTSAQGDLSPPELEALQVLWLRATHRLQLLEEAWQWQHHLGEQGRLQPAAQGVASLVAVDLDRFPQALALADAALAVRPLQVEALVARASVALAERDLARALPLLQRALQCNPDDGRTWSTLGLCSLLARDLPRAQAQLERAVGAMPGHVGTWHTLGWVRLLQQDSAGALQAFRQALALDRNFAESHGAVGLVLALRGETAQAAHHLQLAQRLDPANVTGRYAQALLAGEAGDLSRLAALAVRLLDRPGFGAGKLSDAVAAAIATAHPRR